MVDGSGLLNGVWLSIVDEVIYARQQPDGAWASRPVAASGAKPVLALDADGAAHIAWEANDDGQDIYYATIP